MHKSSIVVILELHLHFPINILLFREIIQGYLPKRHLNTAILAEGYHFEAFGKGISCDFLCVDSLPEIALLFWGRVQLGQVQDLPEGEADIFAILPGLLHHLSMKCGTSSDA